jgi:hypothetical protein
MAEPDVNSMAVCRIELARLVDHRGDHERARTILESNLQTFRTAPTTANASNVVARLFETWHALLRIGVNLDSMATDDWARQAFGLLGLTADVDKIKAGEKLENGLLIQRLLGETAAAQRQTGKLESARRYC